MIRGLFVLLTLLLIAGVASAQCYSSRVVSYSYPTYSTYHAPYVEAVKVVKEKVIEPVYVPFALPVYQAFYVPGYVAPTAPAAATDMPAKAQSSQPGELQQVLSEVRNGFQGINQKVDNIDARVRVLEGRPGGGNGGGAGAPPPLPPGAAAAPKQPTAADGLLVLQNKCAQCHETKTAAKGRNVVLLTGPNVAKLSDRTLVQSLKVLGKGTMPPAPHAPLTEQETGALFVLFDSLKPN
jgi:cytochrome c553